MSTPPLSDQLARVLTSEGKRQDQSEISGAPTCPVAFPLLSCGLHLPLWPSG